jgi:DNA-binding IclR family transcriptional regulator
MEPYEQLIAVLDAFIDEFDGGMRIRGVKTAMLIQQATAEGCGISISEIARRTGAPLENVRRHIAKHVELGSLRYVEDPNDERVTLVMSTGSDMQRGAAHRIAARLAPLDLDRMAD